MILQFKTNLGGAILGLAALVYLAHSPESAWAQEGGQADSLPAGAESAMIASSSADTGGPGDNGATPTAPAGTLAIDPGLPEPSSTPGGDQEPGAGAGTLTGQPGYDKDVTAVTGESRRFKYGFHLSGSTTYDDNIFLTDHRKRGDVYFNIAPAVTVGFGDMLSEGANYVRLDYSPNIFLFAKHSGDDAVQHLIRLVGQYTFSKLTIRGSQDVEILDGADLATLDSEGETAPQTNVDVSGRTRVNIYTTRLEADYPLSGKVSLNFGGHYTVDDYSTLIDSSDFSADLYCVYEYSPKLSFGAGLTGGYQYVTGSPDQGFFQTNLRGTYQLSGKVFINGSVGVEFRQSTDESSIDVTPVFELAAVYAATDSTTLTLSATRQVTASAVLKSQDFESTSVTASVRQRFFQRLFLSLTLGYENDDYVSEQTGVTAKREDNYFTIRPALEIPIREGLSVSIFYLYRANHSSGAGDYSFADNQVGLSATFNF